MIIDGVWKVGMIPPITRLAFQALAGTVRAFGRVVSGPASPAVSPLSGECPDRVDRPHLRTMPSADFCHAVGAPRGSPSHESVTRNRPPEVSSTAFPTHPPDLPSRLLMAMDFAVIRPLVPALGLISGFCSSGREFAPRFLQTPPRGDALALR